MNRLVRRIAGEWIYPASLLAITVAVYWPVLTFEFVNYDDDAYVTQSPLVRGGLTTAGLVRAVTRFEAANWHPLTWLSLMLDWQIFGLDPRAFHAVNLLLHSVATLLLFQTLKEATGNSPRSALVAALFAIHPLHVESVAWVSERKDVLSGVFWMLTLWVYGRFVRQQTLRWRGAVYMAFVLGLMSKPMLVTLPCVLLLWDVWPLGRWSPDRGWPALGRLLLEKIPLILLSGAVAVLTVLAQRAGGAIAAGETISMTSRLANAVAAVTGYLLKTFWPFSLSVFYPHSMNEWPAWHVALAGVVLVALSILAFRQISHRPELTVGWFWFLGTLIPVIGLVQVGTQAMADRYTYLPLIGLFFGLAWGFPEPPLARKWAVGAWAVVVLLLGVRASSQVWVWQNSRTLFTHAVNVVPSSTAHNNLGLALRDAGEIAQAESHFVKALELSPTNTSAWANLGATLQLQGRGSQAEECYERVLALDPRHAAALTNRGGLLIARGRAAEAEPYLRRAVRAQPEFADAHANLGLALSQLERFEDAERHLKEALRLRPELAQAWAELGELQVRRGDENAAIGSFRRALERDASLNRARHSLALALAIQRQWDEATREVEILLERNPGDIRATEIREVIRLLRNHRTSE